MAHLHVLRPRQSAKVGISGRRKLTIVTRYVTPYDFRGRAIIDEPAIGHAEDPRAEVGNRTHVMAHQKNGPPLLSYLAHLSQALSLEGEITNCEYFIDQKDLGFQVRSHS